MIKKDEVAILLTLQMNQATELLGQQAHNKGKTHERAELFQTLLAIRKNSIKLEKMVRQK